MPLENQVISLDLAKELAEVMKKKGVTPPHSLYAYYFGNGGEWQTIVETYIYEDEDADFVQAKLLPAYTVAELGEMLPSHAYSIKEKEKWVCGWWGETTEEQILRENRATIGRNEEAETETDARCKMLIYLLKNNLMTL